MKGFRERIVDIKDRTQMAMLPSQIPRALEEAKNTSEQALFLAKQQSDLLEQMIVELKAIRECLENMKRF